MGHCSLFLQLQGSVFFSSVFSRVFLLCDLITLSIFGVHEYDSFTLFLFRILWSLCLAGKCFSRILKNSFPIFVDTLSLKGGLNQMIARRRRDLLGWVVESFPVHFRCWLWPLFCSASWYMVLLSLNTVSLLEIMFNRLLIMGTRFFFIEEGWLEFL